MVTGVRRPRWLAPAVAVLCLLVVTAPGAAIDAPADRAAGSAGATDEDGGRHLHGGDHLDVGDRDAAPGPWDQVVELAERGRTTAAAVSDQVDRSVTQPALVRDSPGPWTLPYPVLVLGYTRHVDDDPLDNDARRRLHEAVQASPGAHIAALVDRTEIPRSTARYHLRVLEGAGLLESGTVRGKHRFVPAGEDLTVAAALHDPPTRAVIEAVDRDEPLAVSTLADRVGRAPSTVSHHLDRLADAGLVERDPTGDRTLVRLGPAAPEVGGSARIADGGRPDGERSPE